MSIFFLQSPSFAEEGKKETSKKQEKKKTKKSKTSPQKVKRKSPVKKKKLIPTSNKKTKKAAPKKAVPKKATPKTKSKKTRRKLNKGSSNSSMPLLNKSKTSQSNDASLNTINPNSSNSQTHSTSTPKSSSDSSLKRKKSNVILPGLQPKQKDTQTATGKRRTTKEKKNSTGTAIAATAAAAVGMGVLAAIPGKGKKIACPFNKARIGPRGGAQFSNPEENALGAGGSIGYRWCNPFAVDLSYVHYGALQGNINSPVQASVQMFIPGVFVLSPYITGGMSAGFINGEQEQDLLYGPHGGGGVQILFGKGHTALNLEGRYTHYLNAPEQMQNNQIHAMLGLDFYL